MSHQSNTRLVASAKQFVQNNIATSFHNKLLEGLQKLKLHDLLRRKNPYLFRAKSIATADELVRGLLDAHLSSKEETIFGDFLESLAIHVCAEAFGGQKSSSEGIDLEFSRDGKRYIVSIKSGPNWANSQQLARMKSNFSQAKKIAGVKSSLEAINGCCYGKEKNKHKGTYIKLCGQEFWSLISGLDDFYLGIIEPLGFEAKKRTDEFSSKYSAVVNQFTGGFITEFCTKNGDIRWEELLKYNSAKIPE